MNSTPLVLGIDPGISRTGWGIVSRTRGGISCQGFGVLRPRGAGLGARLRSIVELLGEVLATHSPTEAAVEDIFHHRNARSAFVLGQARGAALVALATAGLEPAAYAPAMVKRVVTGMGNADKLQVARAVGAILGVNAPQDAQDALAIAMCHVLAGGARQMIRAGLKQCAEK